MSDLVSGGIGFAAARGVRDMNEKETDHKIYRTAIEAARRKFSPEFMNRIDKVVVFRSLKEQHLREILELELQAVQDRITLSAETEFTFQCSETAKDELLKEGIDYKYGARHLKRAIERMLVYPLSNLVASEQIGLDDMVFVDLNPETGKFTFSKQRNFKSGAIRRIYQPNLKKMKFGIVMWESDSTDTSCVYIRHITTAHKSSRWRK